MLELLREVGYDRMTMDAVAARAKVSKATIYRRWAGKPELVADALRARQAEVLAPADTGTLRGDLQGLLRLAARICVDDAPLMQAMAFAMDRNPELARARTRTGVPGRPPERRGPGAARHRSR